MIRPKKICSICRQIKKADCERCKPQPFANINRDNQSFYNHSLWRKVSKSYRQRNPLCIECKANDIIKEAQVVDHIISIDSGGEKYAETNLQSLCHTHHNSKTGRSRNKQ